MRGRIETDRGTCVIRAATSRDVGALVDLLGASVPDCLPQTVWELPWMWRHYRVACSPTGEIVGAASLQPQSGGRAELRGLTVTPEWRGRGIAGALVNEVIDAAERSSLDVLCVTRFPDFFGRFGFRETAPRWVDHRRRTIPAARRERRVAMTRSLAVCS